MRSGQALDRHRFDAFVDSLAHRGPDGRGTWFDANETLGLGHRRLAILDPRPVSDQPMADSHGRYVVVFNGEIYNFIELRDELSGLGHTFHTDCDTEVLLAAYRQWGEECQFRFNGMWAFAIWDAKERSLFLSRDRFGVKPLHYFWDGKVFAFASEMKAFLKMQGYCYRLDEGALAQALADYTALEGTERCLFLGVSRLIGGHNLRISRQGAPIVRRWWRTLDHLPEIPARHEERVEQFRSLLIDATSLRLRSDVTLGTALSGGLDSSSILACGFEADRQNRSLRRPASWRTALIADFEGTSQDETRHAVAMSEHVGAQSRIVKIDPREAMDHLDDIVFSLEEIYDILAALWLTYRAMRKEGIVVSMDGHGGDELLAGYHHYPEIAFRDAIRHGALMQARNLSKIHRHMHAPMVPFQPLSVSGSLYRGASGRVRRYLQGAKQVLQRKWSSAGVWRDRPDGEKDPA